LVAVIIAFLFVLGILYGRDPVTMFTTAIAIAVAAIG